MTVNSSTGLVSWPSPVAGTHNVTITVSDGQKTINQSYTLTILQAPAVPTGIAVTPGSVSCGYNTLFTMSWSPVAGPGGHAVEYQVDFYGSPQAWVSATSFQVVYPNTFYFRVRSRDAVTLAVSAWSAETYVYDDCSGW
jgi:hypothetical protein